MKHKILLALFAISLIFSTLLAFAPIEKICNDETSGCSLVQNSEYKSTLGINNSYSGIFIFTILILITVSQIKNPTSKKQNILISFLTISTLAASYFIYIQLFIIKAICPYCMTIDIATIVSLTILTIKRNK